MIVAQHYFEKDKFQIRQFASQSEAADFIDFLVSEDSNEH